MKKNEYYCKHCKRKIKSTVFIRRIKFCVSDKPFPKGRDVTYPCSKKTRLYWGCPKCGEKVEGEGELVFLACFSSISERKLMTIIRSKFSRKYKEILRKEFGLSPKARIKLSMYTSKEFSKEKKKTKHQYLESLMSSLKKLKYLKKLLDLLKRKWIDYID